MKSYVISASLGAGCYRHIRIGDQETLDRLHELILDAFDFDDDHAHAFFMDDRYWSDVRAYFSDYLDDGEKYSSDVTLRQLRLKKGDKFKFLFDFGDEWRFQCRVLRELEERTDIPGVIRTVGEAPEQYPDWEEDDEEDDDEEMEPEEECALLTEEDRKKLFSNVPATRETIDEIRKYLRAAIMVPPDLPYGGAASSRSSVYSQPHLLHFHSLLLNNFLLGKFVEAVFPGNERQAAPIVPGNAELTGIIHVPHSTTGSGFYQGVWVIHVVQHNTCAGWIILSDRLHMLTAGKRHIHLLFSSLSDNFITRVRIHSPSPPWHKNPWLGNGHPSHKGVSVHTGFSAKPGGPV